MLDEFEEIKPPKKFENVAKGLYEGITLFKKEVALLRDGLKTKAVFKVQEAMQISYTAGFYFGKAQADIGSIIISKLE